MAEKAVVLKKEDSIATVTLNRPKQMNSIDDELYDGFLDLLEDINQDDKIKAVIITGEGPAFCVGFDFNSRFLTGIAGNSADTKKGCLEAAQLHVRVRNLAKPVVAAVNGHAIAAGLSLALACDMMVVSERAQFCEGHINFASIPDCGVTFFLTRLLGPARAFEFMLTGKTIDAKEGERIGLVNKVVAPENLEAAAKELAISISKAPLGLLKLLKPVIYQAAVTDLQEAIDREVDAQVVCVSLKECLEVAEAYSKKFTKKA